jgi:hypothetical protein
MYPQDIMFQLTQDKCSLLDAFMEGQQVEVSFNLKGREWTSPQGEVKYFNTLEAFRVEQSLGVSAPKPIPAAQPAVDIAGASAPTAATDNGDLPF